MSVLHMVNGKWVETRPPQGGTKASGTCTQFQDKG